VEPPSRDDVDVCAEASGKALLHADEVDQVELGFRVIIDNHVARRTRVASGHRPEDVKRRHAARVQRGPFGRDQASDVLDVHDGDDTPAAA